MEKEIKKSPCCNAKIDVRGGGYVEKDIVPIEDFCVECGQTLAVNGIKKREIFNPKTGKLIRQI